ncbi:MAG: 3-oxoacyl-ACP reductase FabG [Oscillospiraceae bacterium]|jgi:3-oxoacyl-[acyl-carrier protein] reductase|nr:3-oxoacyl-ACP reductase FabG [Oscillospiraceae bacterium]
MAAALITGASGAIGAAIARALAAGPGERPLILHACRHPAAAEALARELPGSLVCTADLTDEAAVDALFRRGEEAFGGVDILVNNAGVALPQQLMTDTSAVDFDRLFAVNVRAAFLCCRRAAPYMVRQKAGRIVNISSMWGVAGGSCEVAYSAAKAAVIGLTRALARELGPSGVTVNCVAPGVIDTPMNAHLSPEELAALAEQTPMGRLGSPEEVAAAVRFFAEDAAGFCTGQVLGVDGGFL